jgi:hypothetical protein
MEKKREGDREAAGEVFLSSDPLYHCFFVLGHGKGELLKLLLAPLLCEGLIHPICYLHQQKSGKLGFKKKNLANCFLKKKKTGKLHCRASVPTIQVRMRQSLTRDI